jgi:hypothetical protein
MAALRAYQMIVVIGPEGGFIPGKPVSETPKGRDTRFGEQFHGAVGRGKSDSGSPFLDLLVNIFGTDVTPVPEEGAGDQFPLRRHAKTLAPKIILKYIKHFPRHPPPRFGSVDFSVMKMIINVNKKMPEGAKNMQVRMV